MTTIATDFTALAAFEVQSLRDKAHLGTPQAPSIDEIEAILVGETIEGVKVACLSDQCSYCGTAMVPMADTKTGRRPFPHYGTRQGDVCMFGTTVDPITEDSLTGLR